MEFDELSLESKSPSHPSLKTAPSAELARLDGPAQESGAAGGMSWQAIESRPSASVQRKAVQRLEGKEAGQSWQSLDRRPLQRRAQPVQRKGDGPEVNVHAEAAKGISGASHALPHLDTIQQAFGHHDVSSVKAHTDEAAGLASASMGARAYASGNDVAFAGAPDLHTAAHEAAHVVQQRAGVSLSGGVGQVGDSYEQHADQVADAVVAGKSAAGLLDVMAGGTGGDAVQRAASDSPSSASASTTDKPSTPKLEETDKKGQRDAANDADKANKRLLVTGDDLKNSEQFKLFTKRMEEVINKVGLKDKSGKLENAESLAKEVWLLTVNGLAETNAANNSVEKKKMAVGREDTGDVRKSERIDLEAKAFQDLIPKFNDLATKLKGFAKLQGQNAKHWAFWSTGAGKELAKNCEMSLEGGSIGFLFDGLNLSGDGDMQLWGALSKAYAEAAVDTLEEREIEVFIGPYVADLTVYDAIESKVLVPAADKDPNLKLEFHAVASKSFDAKAADTSVTGGKFPGVISSHKDKKSASDAANAWADARFKDVYAENKAKPKADTATKS